MLEETYIEELAFIMPYSTEGNNSVMLRNGCTDKRYGDSFSVIRSKENNDIVEKTTKALQRDPKKAKKEDKQPDKNMEI
ncbi:hypothetical protein NPIL_382951 [Nephila pilipes]|uniref:Uncharacterized protein n=1 Tax=Nephila pilipes TaxID=299642 RepID=A0A8X6QGE2_NEPPI|nr:hypothetical protein NPIL_382951 [Nephila pilipes]